MSPANLPAFKKPPVVETVLAVQFEPIPGFTNAHLGAFWVRIGGRERWPLVQDANPLPQEFERFGEERKWQRTDTLKLDITSDLSSRMQLRNAEGSRLLQIQNGRLIYNWLGTSGKEYARYDTVRPEFDEHLQEFNAFLADQKLPALHANQWEVTYINHLPKGTVWNDVTDWQNVFNFSAVPPAALNDCRLESFAEQWVYEIAPRRGRLRMQFQHAWNQERQEVLLFNLTARGPVQEGDGAAESIQAGLDLGREVIVSSFANLVSSQARKFWEECTDANA